MLFMAALAIQEMEMIVWLFLKVLILQKMEISPYIDEIVKSS
ncbi:MAG: hypothetical protein ACYDEX_14400 [Mobilitalea sp.]